MIRPFNLIGLMFVCLITVKPSYIMADQSTWSFVWVGTGADKFYLSEGRATVVMREGSIESDMIGKNGDKYVFKGSINGNEITGILTSPDTDAGEVVFRGTYKVARWEHETGQSTGRRTIVLSDGLNALILTKEIYSVG